MPAIWLIDAYRAGERGQVRALAEYLVQRPGWTLETMTMDYRTWGVWPHVIGTCSLAGVVPSSRSQLKPPWPDIVISCGVRNEPVCRWLRQQSGGRTRYVHVGRPWGPLDQFDLVVTTPQYRVPEYPTVLNNALTLHSLTAERLRSAASHWRERFAHLPGPYIAVNLGGNSGPYTLGPNAAIRLAGELNTLAQAAGASLLISSSSRTSVAALDTLETALSVPHLLYRWRANDGDNPYLGMLALADAVVVTADSIAMLSEACATAKPVYMFDIGGMRDGFTGERDFRLGASLYGALMRFGWQRLSRDITLVHQQLEQTGRARWLTDAVAERFILKSDVDANSAVAGGRERAGGVAVQEPGSEDMQRAANAIVALLAEPDLPTTVD